MRRSPPSPPPPSTISLCGLLGLCVSLCHEACAIIRDVQCQREADGGRLAAELKDPTDPRTYLTAADERAQRCVIAGLRTMYGDTLDIVGEEEEDDDEVTVGDSQSASPAEASGMDGGYDVPAALQQLFLRDVVVFVDPVDGTREFVEGRLEAVQCLIGVAYRGRPIAGAVGLPFLATESGSTVVA